MPHLLLHKTHVLAYRLQSNGMKVLGLIPGLNDRLPGQRLSDTISVSLTQHQILTRSGAPGRINDQFGLGLRGVSRTKFHQVLIDEAERQGIQIHWDHKLIDIRQTDVDVTAIFQNGKAVTGSFAVGCDGLHSGSRVALFGQEEATFTGLTQVLPSFPA